MNRTRDVSSSDDVIDSRDVISRIDELTDERTTLADAAEEARAAFLEAAGVDYKEATAELIEEKSLQDAEDAILAADAALMEWDNDSDGQELKALQALAEQAEGYAGDWQHGAALIRDSYFEDYARQFAEDIGAVKDDAGWPNTCIDWKQAAEELQQDYTSVEFDGVTYWVR